MAKKNARNTRGKIVEAAWQLFYEQGYEDTTVEESSSPPTLQGLLLPLFRRKGRPVEHPQRPL